MAAGSVTIGPLARTSRTIDTATAGTRMHTVTSVQKVSSRLVYSFKVSQQSTVDSPQVGFPKGRLSTVDCQLWTFSCNLICMRFGSLLFGVVVAVAILPVGQGGCAGASKCARNSDCTEGYCKDQRC